MSSFKLSPDQEMSIFTFKDFIEDKSKIEYLLEGHAGSGKTTILKMYIDILRRKKIPFTLCAPTHRAKMVLQDRTKCLAFTLHSLLSMKPNIDIFNLDLAYLKFKSGGSKEFPTNGVVICDEASMINDELYDLILQYAKLTKTKIVFVGDKAQLQAVGDKKISKVFDVKNKGILTEIHRQDKDNDIFGVLNYLRANPIYDWTLYNDLDSVKIIDSPQEYLKIVVEESKEMIKREDVNYCKVLAFRNVNVQGINKHIRNHLFENVNQFNIGEILTGYDNFEYNNYTFYNSSDYVVVDVHDKELMIPNFGSKMKGYNVKLFDPIFNLTANVFVVSIYKNDMNELKRLTQFIERVRQEAIILKQNNRYYQSKNAWKVYFKTINSFAIMKNLLLDGRIIKKKTFDWGYSSTIHKVQGVTLDNVYIDMSDVLRCKDREQLRQLQYVSMSRTTNKVNLFI